MICPSHPRHMRTGNHLIIMCDHSKPGGSVLRAGDMATGDFIFSSFRNVGSHTVLELLKSGYRATVIDNFDNAFEACYERMKKLAGDKADRIKLIKVSNAAGLQSHISGTQLPACLGAAVMYTIATMMYCNSECRATCETSTMLTRLSAPTSQCLMLDVTRPNLICGACTWRKGKAWFVAMCTQI
jgi:hypothetical protein